MNKWDKRERQERDVIADAVRTYPLAPIPPGLTQAIMTRIRETAPAPRFELGWIDLALGLLGASMTGLAWLLWQWLPNWQSLPNGQGVPNWLDWVNMLVPNTSVLLSREDMALGAIGIVGGLFAMGLCLVIALVVLAPRPVIRLERVSR